MAGLVRENCLCCPQICEQGPRAQEYTCADYGSPGRRNHMSKKMPAVEAESLTKRGIRRPDMAVLSETSGVRRSNTSL